MRKDHRPYGMKKAYLKFQNLYANHFLRPHFERFGKGHAFMKPWNVEVFGGPVELGDFATVIATRDQIIRLSVWSVQEGMGRITIGSYCLICPGVRISSGSRITIGDNCMMASGVYITDADWHGIYDRAGFGRTLPVSISDNVWIGDRAMICKGVSIGENSIIGAGSVVVEPCSGQCDCRRKPGAGAQGPGPRNGNADPPGLVCRPFPFVRGAGCMGQGDVKRKYRDEMAAVSVFPRKGD